MAFGKKTTEAPVKAEPVVDPVVVAIGVLTEQVKLLREDVQRAGVMSGLLSRPGGQSFTDIVESAKRFADQTKD